MIECIALFICGIAIGTTIMFIFCKYTTVPKVSYNTLEKASNQSDQKIEEYLQKLTKQAEEIGSLKSQLGSSEIHQKNIDSMYEQLKGQFRSISIELLATQTDKFDKQSQQKILTLLEPFKSDIQKVNESIQKECESRASVVTSNKLMVERVLTISKQTDDFITVLKGDNKAQGKWGEFILEKILDETGLRKGKDYIIQGKEMDLKDSENKAIQPDIVVCLPENKHILIDSKVSFIDYEKYHTSDNEEDKKIHLKNLMISLKKHIQGLSEKSYQTSKDITSPDFVLMFLFSENLFNLAIQKEPSLIGFAHSKKIVIVSPTTLYATLTTVGSLWKLAESNRNAIEIAKKCGYLYDKLVLFVEDMTTIRTRLDNAGRAYEEAMHKLHRGKGNILSRAEGLKKLGVQPAKNLPKDLLEKADYEIEHTNEQDTTIS